MISIVQQKKHIEEFFLRFDLIDNLSLKAYDFCDKLIRSYYHRPLNEYYRQEHFIGVLGEYEDSFVSALMPSIKKSITEYKMLIEFIDACNEVLEEYKQNKKIKKYQEALQLKKSYIRAYNRITKEIERKMQKIIDERFPELVKLVHKYVISQTIPLDSVIREFENLVSDLMDDIRKAQ